jgi:hypothetical protein
MTEVSKTCTLSTLPDTPNAISSQESAVGPTPSASLDGLTPVPVIQPRVLASLSARQAKAAGCLMSGTYGQPSSTSSNSLDLTLSLESKLQAKLDSRGSTLFKLTWKRRATPQQRSIFALRASGLRTSVSVYSGVPTPMAGTPAQNGNNEAGNNDYSRKIVALASVPTPNLPTGGPNSRSTLTHTGGMDLEGAASLASLDLQVRLAAAAATPAARDYKSNSSTEEFQLQQWNHPRGKPLSAQATLADSGKDATGGTGVTKSSGQLNPEYSRWLQGYPKEWGNCADMVIPSSRKSRRNS